MRTRAAAHSAAAVVAIAGLTAVAGLGLDARVRVTFSPQDGNPAFAAAAEQYRAIWAAEGTRIVEALERASRLRFAETDIQVEVYEGTSFSGIMGGPMRLRASYAPDIKKGTLIHELGHRLNVHVTARPADLDEHRLLFLYLYDLYDDLYGREFADAQVAFGRSLRGLYDYDSAWNWALAMTREERSARFAEVLKANGVAAGSAQDAPAVTAVVGATVIGAGGAPLANATIVVGDGRIARVGPLGATDVPPNATVIDARGKFVIPGLADMHNHVRSGSTRTQQNARTVLTVLLAHGVTTVFNPSVATMELSDLHAATAAAGAPAPRLFGTGPSITVEGDMLGAAVGSLTPRSAAEARAAVQTLKAAGADAIKVVRDDLSWASSRRISVMRADVLAALVDEAHREQLKVFAHAPLLAHAKDVLRAGADGLLHGIIDRPVDQELIDLLIRNRAVYVPTLSLYEGVADVASFARRQSQYHEGGPLTPIVDSFAAPEFVRLFESLFDSTASTRSRLSTQRENLLRLFEAGVPVVMGTDAGTFGVMMGVSSQLELALMVEAGLSPEAALRAATINAARMIGREAEAGSIEPGKVADLVILDANPLDDIGNLRRIHRVIRGGVVHDPAQLLSRITVTGPTRGGRGPVPGRGAPPPR